MKVIFETEFGSQIYGTNLPTSIDNQFWEDWVFNTYRDIVS